MPGGPVKCPTWEYKNVPGAASLLASLEPAILSWLNTLPPADRVSHVTDTRSLHRWLFVGLTPPGFDYYSGHYRGEDFLCLRHCEVGIPANPLVGCRPQMVATEMRKVANGVTTVLSNLDVLWPVPEKIFSKAAKIRRTAELVAALFNSFLLTHPYVNGNGHMARFIVVAMFSRYNLRLRRWPINQRPPDPPYSSLITSYQQGYTEGFIQFLLRCL
jgi:Fic/DOC family